MIEKLVLPEIKELIEAQDLETLGDVLNGWLPADLAGLMARLGPDEQIQALRALKGPPAAQTFEYLELATQERLLEALTEEDAARLLEAMAPDDRTALLGELPPERAERLLALLSPKERAVAQALLQYAPDSIGRLMTPDFVTIRKDWTIKRVLDHVRTRGRDSETLNVIYVVDDREKLIDDLRIREVLLAPLHANVREILDGKFVTLNVTDDKATAVGVFRKYDRSALPVVDAKGTLLGIVTIDDVLDVAEQEATEEIQRFGGLEALDEPYVATPFWSLVRKRATWLVVLFLGEMLTATAMGFFEGEIQKAVVLALFVPLIISSGGNSGSQAATLIIRALALGEVRLRDWWMVMRRELGSGLALGLILGSIGFLRIALWSQFSDLYGPYWYLVAVTVSVSLVGIVLWGTLSGSMLPFLLKRLGLDPATSSAPFVATLVDVTGLVIYFTVAFVVLRTTLLKPQPPAIGVVKLTNDTDNNTAPGPQLPVGSRVTFAYYVTTTSSEPLGTIRVVDDDGTPAVSADDLPAAPLLAAGTKFNIGDANRDNLLEEHETWVFTAHRIATAGPNTNTGTASGIHPSGTTVTATDVDHHFGVPPAPPPPGAPKTATE